MTDTVLFIGATAADVRALRPYIDRERRRGRVPHGLALWTGALAEFETLGVASTHPSAYVDRWGHQRVFDATYRWAAMIKGAVAASGTATTLEGLDLVRNLDYDLELVLTSALFESFAMRSAVERWQPQAMYVAVAAASNSAEASVPVIAPGAAWSLQRMGLSVSTTQLASELAKKTGIPLELCTVDSESASTPCNRAWRWRERAFYMYRMVAPGPLYILRRRVKSALHQQLIPRRPGRIVVIDGEQGKGVLLNELERRGFTCVRLDDLFSGRYPSDRKSSQAVAFSRICINPPVGDDDGFPAVGEYATRLTHAIIHYHLPAVTNNARWLFEFAEAYRPAAYLTTYTGTLWHRATIWAFHQRGVPCFETPHDLNPLNHEAWQPMRSNSWVEGPQSRFCTSTEAARAFADIAQAPRQSLTVIGTLDSWIGMRPRRAEVLCARRLLRINGSVVILYTATAGERGVMRAITEETMFEALDATRDIVATTRHLPKTRLVVKLHPGQHDPIPFLRICSGERHVRVTRDLPFAVLAEAAAIVVTHHSTTAIEALYRGCDLIVYDTTKRPTLLTPMTATLQPESVREHKVALLAEDRASLLRSIRIYIDNDPIALQLRANRRRALPDLIANARAQHDAVNAALVQLRARGVKV
ncbi:MAG: hypothetical protein HYV04_06090 [Deltaproteobacteria bacterium]|nr:hypothetical protein [Deltaproteobacteria bacterium]